MRRIIAILFVLLAWALHPIGGTEFHLATDGTTDYTIVLPSEPSAVQRTAAEELASFLNQVTGAQFPILSENNVTDNKKLLVIGPSALSTELLAGAEAEPEETIGYDGIILQPVDDILIFSGHPKRGPLYAVYTFLEDYVGCRWWTSTESTIPSKPTLDVEVTPQRYAPKVISREAYYLDPLRKGEGGIFSARTKMNGEHNPVPPEFGGHETFSMSVHTFFPILPPGDYFDEHPDWYALVGGKRQKENCQLCLTNPEMKEVFIRNTLEILAKNPNSKIISVSQNDWGGWCQCEQCQKLVDENGSQAGPLITFVNEVAEAVEKEYPDVLVETLAYQDTRFAPTKVRPRDNVVVRLCSIEYSFLTPFIDGGPYNQSFTDCIEKWSAISKNLYIWDYVTNFNSYLLPHPNLQVLAPNIRYFVDHHAIGIFEQGDAGCAAGDFVRLRNWIISKLLWNPDLDPSVLEEEFLTGYYSPRVGALLRRYLDVLKQSALESNILLRCYHDCTSDWLSPEALVEATKLMDQAIAAAEEDEQQDPVRYAGLVKKVMRESIPIRLSWIREWQDYNAAVALRGIPSPIQGTAIDYFNELRTALDENDVQSHREWGSKEAMDRWLDNLRHLVDAPRVDPPKEVEGLPVDTWFDAQEFKFLLIRADWNVFIENDSNASNMYCARMPGDHSDWSIACYTGHAAELRSPAGLEPDENGRVRGRVLLYARCDAPEDGADKAAADKVTLTAGVLDELTGKVVCEKSFSSSELAGNDYKVFDLGTFQLGYGIQIWSAPVKDASPNVYIDRIVIIRE